MYKWIGGLIGFFLFGRSIFGALIGIAFGALIDSSKIKQSSDPIENRNRFIDSLLILFSFVMKADGRVTKIEVNYVRAFLEKNIGKDESNKKMLQLRDILKDDSISLSATCNTINSSLNYSQRLELLHFLFEISSVDYDISKQELNTIHDIASKMKISAWDFGTIQAMYFQSRQSSNGYYQDNRQSYSQPYQENTDIYYTILQVNRNASDEEIKKAYKKLVKKYHPDKVASLGEDIQRQANEKFQQINDAYEKIKQERKFN